VLHADVHHGKVERAKFVMEEYVPGGGLQFTLQTLASNGKLLLHSAVDAYCFDTRHPGVWPMSPWMKADAQDNPNSMYTRPLGIFPEIPDSIFFSQLSGAKVLAMVRSLLAASSYSGLVSFNWRLRASGNPALYDVNARPSGGLTRKSPQFAKDLFTMYAKLAVASSGSRRTLDSLPWALQGERARERASWGIFNFTLNKIAEGTAQERREINEQALCARLTGLVTSAS
jgi:hypothetical protein